MKKEPRGIRNNNPLNIRKGNNWQGERQPQTDVEFEEFESMQYGVRAAFKILKNYLTGYGGKRPKCNTIEKIVKRWAPETENATQSYINSVCRTTGLNRYEVIRFEDRKKMVAIVDAMIRVECGKPIDTDIIESAYDML